MGKLDLRDLKHILLDIIDRLCIYLKV